LVIISLIPLWFFTRNIIKSIKIPQKTSLRVATDDFDLNEMKKVEQMKRDFVMNVSHELRTPLTAIKGFLETMADDVKVKHKSQKKRNCYFDILVRHTDRLINIVNDLSLISKMEDSSGGPISKIEISKAALPDIINNVLKMFEQKIAEQNIMLLTDFNENIPIFYADEFKLEQLFINLIDNAIKYSDTQRNKKIEITAKADKGVIKIAIQDNGIGIPQEHLYRIFERFCTVDKSRSRKFGGTGLGLSLVKHIVNLHKGSINVESKLDTGTIFTVELPTNLELLIEQQTFDL